MIPWIYFDPIILYFDPVILYFNPFSKYWFDTLVFL